MPDGGPTAGTIAWLLWGGTSGVNWAKKKSAAMNAEGLEPEEYAPEMTDEEMEEILRQREAFEEELERLQNDPDFTTLEAEDPDDPELLGYMVGVLFYIITQ